MTEEVFRSDHYANQCGANIVRVAEDFLCLDRTVFYPVGGGQPGDQGCIELASGRKLTVTDTRKVDGEILHFVDTESIALDENMVGQAVDATIDWERRYRIMRVHTLLHLLCSVVPEAVTGGSIRDDGTGRLDFDVPEPNLDKAAITAALNERIAQDAEVSIRWIDDGDIDQNPDLVRTMSVAPPRDGGKVRLLQIAGIDVQACGGTHVARTGEIGAAEVRKIEKKGRQNRRVNVRLLD